MKGGKKVSINFPEVMRILLFSILFVAFHFASGQYKPLSFEGAPLPYLGYVPDNYKTGSEKMPLLLFLHGVGEKGDGDATDLEKVKRWGPPQLVENGQMPRGFIIIAPQLPRQENTWSPATVDGFIKFAINKYRIDTDRIYLTGLSLGGNGTYRYAYSSFNEPNKLAAIAPIAAWGDSTKACVIVEREIPVWAFHGDRDNTVEYERGKGMFDAMSDCGAELSISDYRFTTYENVGHNSWQDAYSPEKPELSLFEWLSYHSLKTNGSNRTGLKLKVIGELPASLPEASGIVSANTNSFWLHNDSGNAAYLINLDSTGSIKDHLKVVHASNYDWEDICKDDEGNLYIGDIGNNANERTELFIYKLNPADQSENRARAEIIRFNYPDQKKFPPPAGNMMYDAEALIHLNNSLYIFTKNRTVPFTGYTRIYRVPDQPGSYEAELIDSLQLGGKNMIEGWITAADISPDKSRIVLLGHDKIYLLTCFGNNFSGTKITEFQLDTFTQKEAVTFVDNHTLFIADESFQNLLKGKLYRVSIPHPTNSGCN